MDVDEHVQWMRDEGFTLVICSKIRRRIRKEPLSENNLLPLNLILLICPRSRPHRLLHTLLHKVEGRAYHDFVSKNGVTVGCPPPLHSRPTNEYPHPQFKSSLLSFMVLQPYSRRIGGQAHLLWKAEHHKQACWSVRGCLPQPELGEDVGEGITQHPAPHYERV